VRHTKVTARAGGVPTAHWLANYTPHTVVPPYAAFYDRLARTMCWCLDALSCSRCDVVNPTQQIRPSAVGAPSPFHLRCVQLPPMRRCQMSDINIGLTLPVTRRHQPSLPQLLDRRLIGHHHHHPRISSRRKSWNKTSGPIGGVKMNRAFLAPRV